LFETDDLTVKKKGNILGIDLGLTSLFTVFDGETCIKVKVDPIKLTKRYAKRLRRRQQALSRKKKESNNRKKSDWWMNNELKPLDLSMEKKNFSSLRSHRIYPWGYSEF